MKEKTILEQEKRQKILAFVFFFVILITALILWKGYFHRPPTLGPELPAMPPSKEGLFPTKKEIEIDLKVLDHPLLKILEIPPKISPPSKEETGKENPFLP